MATQIFSVDLRSLPVYFQTLSREHTQEPVSRSEGFYDLCQLLFVLNGEGVLHCLGKDYPLKRGCAFYVDVGVPHAYESTDGLVTAWITYRGSACEDIRAYLDGKKFVFSPSVDVKAYAAEIARIENEYFEKKREGMLSSMLYSMIFSFFEEVSETIPTPMDYVLRYLEAHFDQKITLDELAKICHASKSTFCKNFKTVYGCTAFEMLIDIRLRNANMMFRLNSSEKVCFVARRCGFEDVSYFCRLYKNKFGLTPAQTR